MPLKISLNFMKDTAVLVGIVIIVLLSLGGVPTVASSYISMRVGNHVVRPYKYGIFVTEPDSGVYYNFSPYNDYIISEEGSTKSLIDWEEGIYTTEYLNREKPVIAQLKTAASYFNINKPTANFETPRGRLEYKAQRAGNKLEVTLNNTNAISKTMLTLSFNETDYVIDEHNNLYTKKQRHELERFRTFYQQELTPKQSSESIVPEGRYLFIINPSSSGVIRVSNEKEANRKTLINPERMLLEFERQGEANPQIEVELFDSLLESRRGI